MKILFLTAFKNESKDIHEAVKRATGDTGYVVIRFDEITPGELIDVAIQKQIESANLVIADTSDKNPNVMYELGLAFALKKPCIIISQRGEVIPFNIALKWTIIYDRNRLLETLETPLRNFLTHVDSPKLLYEEIKEIEEAKGKLKTVFVSYSHVDLKFLERLEVHLKPFEKSGQIELWSDTKIKAGEKWKQQIENSLGKAAIAILLISADFLASDFIVDNELPPILQLAEEKGTTILPVILKPCRFISNPNLSKFQAINDPKNPLSKMDENEREEVFVKIADFIASIV